MGSAGLVPVPRHHPTTNGEHQEIPMPYGYADAAWGEAKAQVMKILRARAKARDFIHYSELAGQVTAIQFNQNDVCFFHLLGEISRGEDSAGRGMMSALVVRLDDGMPGPGFFKEAEDLGKDTTDPVACWTAEVTKVHDFWAADEHG
jgi:hypothetical protein